MLGYVLEAMLKKMLNYKHPCLLEYNPRKNKHWMVYGDFGPPDAIDKEEIEFIYTKKTKLYV